jgi:uncharacterized membrane protein
MTTANWHLMVNHFPIVGSVLALLVILAAFIWKSEVIRRVAFGLVIITAISGIASMQTGDNAEHSLDDLGLDHHMIHEHEEAAEATAITLNVLGLISIAGLVFSVKGKKWSTHASVVVLLGLGALQYINFKTGHSGGLIRHPEIQNATDLQNAQQEQSEGHGEEEHEEGEHH